MAAETMNTNFEAATDAIVHGEIETLAALLRADPDLVRIRSSRKHHAALIHYIGANGVEAYRQLSPPNAVAILRLLLDAGAEVDAIGDMYGGATTLGLVATSCHTSRAGTMFPLLGTLLQAGADINYRGAGGNGQTAIVGCLHNGRPEGADYLASQGAQLDLEAACGTGRIAVVRSFFNDNGTLKENATKQQMESGFNWACGGGHYEVVEFLVQHGIDINKQINGMYGLHYAIMGAWHDITRLLLRHTASLETVNEYGGTALGCALWTIANRHEMDIWPPRTIDDVQSFELILKAGAIIGPGMLSWLHHQNKIDESVKVQIDKLLIDYSATL
jgi:ankyrin repeat protein